MAQRPSGSRGFRALYGFGLRFSDSSWDALRRVARMPGLSSVITRFLRVRHSVCRCWTQVALEQLRANP